MTPYATQYARTLAPARYAVSDEDALRAGVTHAGTADHMPLHVYADWLDERGRHAEAAGYRRAAELVHAGGVLPAVRTEEAPPHPRDAGLEPGAYFRAAGGHHHYAVVPDPARAGAVLDALRFHHRAAGGHSRVYPAVFVPGPSHPHNRQDYGVRADGSIAGTAYASLHHIAEALCPDDA